MARPGDPGPRRRPATVRAVLPLDQSAPAAHDDAVLGLQPAERGSAAHGDQQDQYASAVFVGGECVDCACVAGGDRGGVESVGGFGGVDGTGGWDDGLEWVELCVY